MNLLLEHPASFNLKDLRHRTPYDILYRDVTERTARRDLKKLLERGLLIEVEQRTYSLNLEALDNL